MINSSRYLNPRSSNMHSNATEKSALVNPQRVVVRSRASRYQSSRYDTSPTVVIACTETPAAKQPRNITFHRPLKKFALQPHKLQPCGAYGVQKESSPKVSLAFTSRSFSHRQPYRHSPKQGDHRTKPEDVNREFAQGGPRWQENGLSSVYLKVLDT